MKTPEELIEFFLVHKSKWKYITHKYELTLDQEEDVLQDTALTILEKWESLISDDPFPWIYSIVKNKVFGIYRERQRHPSVSMENDEEDELVTMTNVTKDKVDYKRRYEQIILFYTLINKIPKMYQLVLLKRLKNGPDIKDKTQYHRAKQWMKLVNTNLNSNGYHSLVVGKHFKQNV